MANTVRKPPAAGKGRPKGALNKTTREIKELSQSLLTDPAYLDALKRRLVSGKAPHMETLLHQYAYGKPKDTTEHQGQVALRITWEQ